LGRHELKNERLELKIQNEFEADIRTDLYSFKLSMQINLLGVAPARPLAHLPFPSPTRNLLGPARYAQGLAV